MFEAIAKSFPMAVVIALSPVPILAILLLLMTKRAKHSGLIYLLGWIAGIQLVGTIIILMPGVIADHGGMSKMTGTTKIIAGIVLLLSVIPIWIKKKKEGNHHKIPKIFDKLDELSNIKLFSLGFFFSALSIKNAALAASAAAHIHTTSLTDYLETLSGVFVFALISSITIIIPIILYFLIPKKIILILENWKNWLLKHNLDIIMGMLLLAGVLLIGKGLNIHIG